MTKARILFFLMLCLALACCKQETPVATTIRYLCPNLNPVFIEHHGTDSAMYWIPNCIAAGDSGSANDSLVEFERNLAQVRLMLIDSPSGTTIISQVYNFQNPGFGKNTVWYGNFNYQASSEKCYYLFVKGTTLWGTSFNLNGTVSLLRFYFGNDTVRTGTINTHCDSCTFNAQWNGSNFDAALPTGENIITDATHVCN